MQKIVQPFLSIEQRGPTEQPIKRHGEASHFAQVCNYFCNHDSYEMYVYALYKFKK